MLIVFEITIAFGFLIMLNFTFFLQYSWFLSFFHFSTRETLLIVKAILLLLYLPNFISLVTTYVIVINNSHMFIYMFC